MLDPYLLAYLKPDTLFAISKYNFNDELGSIRIVSNLAALPRKFYFFSKNLFYFAFLLFLFLLVLSESTTQERRGNFGGMQRKGTEKMMVL